MTLTQKIQDQIWSALALVPVGVISVLYIFFKRDFAKIHFNFSFLNFPVFVGEILLCYCLLLLMIRWIRNPPVWNGLYIFASVYLVWFTIKTVIGYLTWGPLALRHAALFYYPFFFMIGYVFFNRQVFTKWSLFGLFSVIEGIFLCRHYDPYWVLTLGCLGLILILNIKDKRFVAPMVLILIFSIPYLYLFKIARMMFVANIVSILFLMAAIYCLLDTKLYIKIIIFILIIIGAWLGFYKFFVLGESNRMFVPPGEVINQFHKIDKTIQKEKSSYQTVPIKVGLYNPEYEKIDRNYYKPKQFYMKNHHLVPIPKVEVNSKEYKDMVEENSVNNIIFRLLIWRDMWVEWKFQKPIFGFDFGKPLRSYSLEVLDWAKPEWGRDGWIEPHNSYFNMLYRAGLVGIIWVVLIWGGLVYFIRSAFERKSWVLVLLSAILLNWMVAANFLLILELPYTAIPFWTLAGMAVAYETKR